MAFVLYAFALTLGTHWPRLELPPTVPATDKSIHLIAFGGLTFLLWKTRWLSALWMVAMIALAWSALDEITQGLPGLNRTVTRYDFFANALGIVVAMAWIWALRTRGVAGGVNRLRLARFHYIVEEMFADRRAWLAGIVAAITAGMALSIYWMALDPSDEAVRMAVTISLFGCAAMAYLGWMRLWRIKHAQAMRDQPCISCGSAPMPDDVRRPAFERACRGCGASQPSSMWLSTPSPSMRLVLRMAMWPSLITIAVLAAGFVLIFISPMVYGYVLGQGGSGARMAPRLVRFFGTAPNEATRVIDLAAHLLLLAVVTRLYRGSLGRFHDRASICMQCGHDLRATPVDAQGVGRCGECGTVFARLTNSHGNTENTTSAQERKS
jgi:VanZ family protein